MHWMICCRLKEVATWMEINLDGLGMSLGKKSICRLPDLLAVAGLSEFKLIGIFLSEVSLDFACL